MISVLINAYACAPNMGSEPGMAWNWIINLANYCKVTVITEGEWRKEIEVAVKELPQGTNLTFHYNPVSAEIRAMCWNQGDWRFYKHYRKWQFKTYQIAKEITKTNKIDVLHQLNMIGFREPGYLWKITDIPFIWGPIGGLKQMPLAYLENAGFKMKLFSRLKNILNVLQLKYDKRVTKALTRADFLISSIPDSYHAIKKHKHLESIIIPETGCYVTEDISNNRFDNDEFHVMWVGKFDFRKQLPLALRTINKTKNKRIILNVFGKGTAAQEKDVKQLAHALGILEQVVWHGNQSNELVLKTMRKAQLFFFTSISEDTSTVVLEAISNRLPVLCFNACGFGAVIDNKVGRKIPLSNPSISVNDFAKELNYLENNRHLLKEMSINCKERQIELSWTVKVKKVLELYNRSIQLKIYQED
ncbi:glycosyltransferase [Maribacter sp. TH_r10]|uniref:glycosyltransferase n=1 Tax=Maribacter sp. TH_r10 TaxID=3082086 RepID=UPI002953E524|nr:glycosyltransferase [Maribacter sp. TH_r10]MDV7140213.1 glycosyltransferase [Maribacter sp. TH_r10]